MSAPSFKPPPIRTTAEGDERRVGFELEYAGPRPEAVAALVVELFGGQVERVGRFAHQVRGTRYGDFTVELDSHSLQEDTYLTAVRKLGIDIDELAWREPLETLLETIAETFVPYEVVTPPIPLSDLARVEALRTALHERQAQGTGSRLIYAFGLHINPEVPSLEAETLLSYLRAYLLLQDWLVERSETNFTRRLSPFVDPFPEGYRKLVLQSDYAPDQDALIEDYLRFSPTRNRPLDMLPVFAMHRPGLVEEQVHEKGLVKARPAFHYRMPNCRIDEPDWSVAAEWNLWWEVERLASEPMHMQTLCDQLAAREESPWEVLLDWLREGVEQWLP